MWYGIITERTSLANPWLLLLLVQFDTKLLPKARTAAVKATISEQEKHRHTVPEFEIIRM
jgi:hypothetical protein